MENDASITSAVACGPRACEACTPRGRSEGRERASATAAMSRQRRASRRICRSRSRRAFCRCERSTNSMAPNPRGLGLRWLKRCTRMGSAMAQSPHRYAGCANCSTLSSSPRCAPCLRGLPALEQSQEHPIRRGVGGDLLDLDVRPGQLAARAFEETAHLREIALADLPGLRLDLAVVLQREEASGVVEGEVQLLAVVRLEQEDVVAP